MQNQSGQWLLLTADGRVVAGEAHPEGRTILAAPGADVTEDWLRKVPALAAALRARHPEPEAKMVPAPAQTKQIVMPPEAKAAPTPPPDPAPAPEATAEPDGKPKGKAGK